MIYTKETELYKTELLSVDALNDGDGWSWNNWYSLEEGIYLHPDTLFNARKLLKYCREVLQITTKESAGQLQIDDDGYNVCIQLRTGQTLFAFCYGSKL